MQGLLKQTISTFFTTKFNAQIPGRFCALSHFAVKNNENEKREPCKDLRSNALISKWITETHWVIKSTKSRTNGAWYWYWHCLIIFVIFPSEQYVNFLYLVIRTTFYCPFLSSKWTILCMTGHIRTFHTRSHMTCSIWHTAGGISESWNA